MATWRGGGSRGGQGAKDEPVQCGGEGGGILRSEHEACVEGDYIHSISSNDGVFLFTAYHVIPHLALSVDGGKGGIGGWLGTTTPSAPLSWAHN